MAGVETADGAMLTFKVLALLTVEAGANVGSVGRPSPLALKNRAGSISNVRNRC